MPVAYETHKAKLRGIYDFLLRKVGTNSTSEDCRFYLRNRAGRNELAAEMS